MVGAMPHWIFMAQLCPSLDPEVLSPALPISQVTVSTLVLLQLLIKDPLTSYTFPQLYPGLTPHSPGLPSLEGPGILSLAFGGAPGAS